MSAARGAVSGHHEVVSEGSVCPAAVVPQPPGQCGHQALVRPSARLMSHPESPPPVSRRSCSCFYGKCPGSPGTVGSRPCPHVPVSHPNDGTTRPPQPRSEASFTVDIMCQTFAQKEPDLHRVLPGTGPCPPGAQNAVAATAREEAGPTRAPGRQGPRPAPQLSRGPGPGQVARAAPPPRTGGLGPVRPAPGNGMSLHVPRPGCGVRQPVPGSSVFKCIFFASSKLSRHQLP